MNFKKEKVLLLLTNVLGDYKVYSDVKTFEYKGHKFNLQGTYNTGYRISDNTTGVLLGTLPIVRLKDVESESILYSLNYFLNNTVNTDEYNKLIERYNQAEIKEE